MHELWFVASVLAVIAIVLYVGFRILGKWLSRNAVWFQRFRFQRIFVMKQSFVEDGASRFRESKEFQARCVRLRNSIRAKYSDRRASAGFFGRCWLAIIAWTEYRRRRRHLTPSSKSNYWGPNRFLALIFIVNCELLWQNGRHCATLPSIHERMRICERHNFPVAPRFPWV